MILQQQIHEVYTQLDPGINTKLRVIDNFNLCFTLKLNVMLYLYTLFLPINVSTTL